MSQEPLDFIGTKEPAPLGYSQWASKAKTLRALLSDGCWHHMGEMRKAGGWRYGARLLEIKRGEDGGPCLLVEKRTVNGDESEWEYRAVETDGERREKQTKTQRLEARIEHMSLALQLAASILKNDGKLEAANACLEAAGVKS